MLKYSRKEIDMKFEIVCDSSADLQGSFAEDNNISVVPFYVSFDGKNFKKEGVEVPVDKFYEAMAVHEDCFPSTSMPSVQDYIDAFMPIVEKGMPVMCICLTSLFSGSMQSAMTAKQMIEDENEDAKIEVIDSELATALEGLFVMEAVRLRNLGFGLEEASEKLKEIRSTGHIFFTTNDLKYLEHGGRIGKIASVAGNMLNIKPILHFCDGELQPTQLCRGRKRSIAKVIDMFVDYLDKNNMNLEGYYFGTGIGLKVPEYETLINMIQEKFDEKDIKPCEWIKVQIGATIGVHTGPYPVGLGFLKKCEV